MCGVYSTSYKRESLRVTRIDAEARVEESLRNRRGTFENVSGNLFEPI